MEKSRSSPPDYGNVRRSKRGANQPPANSNVFANSYGEPRRKSLSDTKKRKATSLNEETPRTLIENFMDGHETVEASVRKRVRNENGTPLNTRLSPRLHNTSVNNKSFSQSDTLRKKATMKNLLAKKIVAHDTPRTMITDFMGSASEETPLRPITRHHSAFLVDETLNETAFNAGNSDADDNALTDSFVVPSSIPEERQINRNFNTRGRAIHKRTKQRLPSKYKTTRGSSNSTSLQLSREGSDSNLDSIEELSDAVEETSMSRDLTQTQTSTTKNQSLSKSHRNKHGSTVELNRNDNMTLSKKILSEGYTINDSTRVHVPLHERSVRESTRRFPSLKMDPSPQFGNLSVIAQKEGIDHLPEFELSPDSDISDVITSRNEHYNASQQHRQSKLLESPRKNLYSENMSFTLTEKSRTVTSSDEDLPITQIAQTTQDRFSSTGHIPDSVHRKEPNRTTRSARNMSIDKNMTGQILVDSFPRKELNRTNRSARNMSIDKNMTGQILVNMGDEIIHERDSVASNSLISKYVEQRNRSKMSKSSDNVLTRRTEDIVVMADIRHERSFNDDSINNVSTEKDSSSNVLVNMGGQIVHETDSLASNNRSNKYSKERNRSKMSKSSENIVVVADVHHERSFNMDSLTNQRPGHNNVVLYHRNEEHSREDEGEEYNDLEAQQEQYVDEEGEYHQAEEETEEEGTEEQDDEGVEDREQEVDEHETEDEELSQDGEIKHVENEDSMEEEEANELDGREEETEEETAEELSEGDDIGQEGGEIHSVRQMNEAEMEQYVDLENNQEGQRQLMAEQIKIQEVDKQQTEDDNISQDEEIKHEENEDSMEEEEANELDEREEETDEETAEELAEGDDIGEEGGEIHSVRQMNEAELEYHVEPQNNTDGEEELDSHKTSVMLNNTPTISQFDKVYLENIQQGGVTNKNILEEEPSFDNRDIINPEHPLSDNDRMVVHRSNSVFDKENQEEESNLNDSVITSSSQAVSTSREPSGSVHNLSVYQLKMCRDIELLHAKQRQKDNQQRQKDSKITKNQKVPVLSQKTLPAYFTQNAVFKPNKSKSVPTKQKPVPSSRKKHQNKPERLPISVTRSIFNHFSRFPVSRAVMEEVEKVADTYWKNVSSDVTAFAEHAGRKRITEADVELLMKRQGIVTEKKSMYSLVEKYLPMEYREEIIPMARAGNVLTPKY